MKKIIVIYVVALVTYILGNNWYYIKIISDIEEAQYQVKLLGFIPQWLPLVLFIVGLILLLKYAKENN